MPIRTLPDADLNYYLISHDSDGNERADDPQAAGGRLSEAVFERIAAEPVTDVFLMSHGWKGDVPAAIEQYDAWIGAMARCQRDRELARKSCPDFHPLVIGLHWPSLPWGEEEHTADTLSFAAPGDGEADAIEDAANSIAGTERAREALDTVFAAGGTVSPGRMPPLVVEAYHVLAEEAGFSPAGPDAAPGDDAERFDPEAFSRAFRDEQEMLSFGAIGPGGLYAPLRQLSFWQMKKRARLFGESGAASLLRELQSRTHPDVHCHLMGHSFGCIAMSAAIAGAGGDEPLPRPVNSLFLVQGALSLWSYCLEIPAAPGRPGYFRSIPASGKVSGAWVTTQSAYDTAVGKLYPLAAGVASQVSFVPGELPKYGAVGTFGVRGPGVKIVDMPMRPVDQPYDFEGGKVWNLESSQFICEGGGLSGAHSDIAKPEVAHAFWQAVIAGRR